MLQTKQTNTLNTLSNKTVKNNTNPKYHFFNKTAENSAKQARISNDNKGSHKKLFNGLVKPSIVANEELPRAKIRKEGIKGDREQLSDVSVAEEVLKSREHETSSSENCGAAKCQNRSSF